MENNSFKIGDIVMLKSGSPKMTVVYSDNDHTSVVYYNYESNKVSPSIQITTAALELFT